MKKISLFLAVLCCTLSAGSARAFTLASMPCPDGYVMDASGMPQKMCCVKKHGPNGCGEPNGCFINAANECVYTTAAGTTSGCTDPALIKRCCTPKPNGCGERTGGCFLNAVGECLFKLPNGTTTGCPDPDLKKKCCQAPCTPATNCTYNPAIQRCVEKNTQPPVGCPGVTAQMVNGAMVCCKSTAQP